MCKKKRKWARLGICSLFLGALALGGLLLGTQPASAQTCIQDQWTAHGNNQNLTCTSNDVRIASASNIRQTDGVTPLTQCVSGQTFSFIADFNVELTAQTRFDIGLYFATDGDSNSDGALTGTCSANIIRPKSQVAPFLGSANFVQVGEPAADTCGDIDSTHNPQVVTVQVNNVLCHDTDGDGKLNLPNCTSWRQPGSNEVCDDVTDAFPGSPSKCNCDIAFNLPIFVETGSISVTKDSSPASRPEPGGEFTFTISATNTAKLTSVTLRRICDDVHGTIVTTAGQPACAAGTGSLSTGTTCSLPQTLAPGGSYSCSFTADVTSNSPLTQTDIVTFFGTDQNGKAVSASDPAQIAINDVLPAASVVKGLVGIACADVDYRVRVNNTSTAESLTLTALNDDGFGSITSVHDNVLATNCSVPQTIVVGGNYECDFRAHFCGGQHIDKVTGTLNDNEGGVTNPESNQLTVNVSATVGP
jgi:hypothetical protein